jgi:thiamine-monophosphate kinase
MSTLLRDIGEDGLLELLRTRLPEPDRRVLVGFGDDVAMTMSSKRRIAWTTDMMVEGTHFRWRPGFSDDEWARRLGRMLAVSNLSDLASKGAEPQYALLSWGFPGETPVARILAVFDGIVEELREAGAVLLGGDTVRAPQWIMNLAITGEMRLDQGFPGRGAARPKWKLYVTGWPGLARCAFEAVESGADPSDRRAQHFLAQKARTYEGMMLTTQLKGVSIMDVSDGLLKDAGRMAKASEVGLRIEEARLPIHPDVIYHAELTGQAAADLVLMGGEDYELLFAVRPDEEELMLRLMGDKGYAPVTCIGEIVTGSGVQVIAADGTVRKLTSGGFEHFS